MTVSKKAATKEKPGSEAWLSRVWQSQLFSDETLTTVDGLTVKVVYPGRCSREAGPDFRGTLISFGHAQPLRGDVELHVRSSQWLEHRHHFDPAYNNVILHVVLQHDCDTLTPLQNGNLLSVLPLDGKISNKRRLPNRQFAEPCPLRTGYRADLSRILDRSGEERFFNKASAFGDDIAIMGQEQAFYKGMMRALGYAHNKEPFQELAQQLPLAELRNRAGEQSSKQAHLVLQACLIGSAGLLPGQRGLSLDNSDPGNEMERLWRSQGIHQATITKSWRYRGVRPENWPVRRLAAAGHLIADNHGTGLLAAVLKKLSSHNPKPEDIFLVPATDYWAEHYDFGVIGARGLPLIGQGRAAEITVNVTLPFIWAWGQANQRIQLSSQALELYRSYPKLGQNQVTRLMKELLFPKRDYRLKSACQQQGLLHLYHTFCQEKKCAECCDRAKS